MALATGSLLHFLRALRADDAHEASLDVLAHAVRTARPVAFRAPDLDLVCVQLMAVRTFLLAA
jgi:hypothetical protein